MSLIARNVLFTKRFTLPTRIVSVNNCLQVYYHSNIQTIIPNPHWRRLKQRTRLVPARKPRWLPPAPSKLFRIPVHPSIPKDEEEELKRLYQIYRTEMKSIKKFWIDEYVRKTSGTDLEQRQREEAEEHQQLMEINRLENERVAKMREERMKKIIEEEEERLLQAEIKRKEATERIQLQVDEIVRQEKLKSSTYITRDKLEKAIEEALANPVNYNFAIDLDGNVYWEDPEKKMGECKYAN